MSHIKDHRVNTLICTYQYILSLAKLDLEAPFDNEHLVTDSVTVSPSGMVLSLETTEAVTHILSKICDYDTGRNEIAQSDITKMLIEIVEHNLHPHMYNQSTGMYYTHNTVNANIEFKYRHNLEYVKQIACLQKNNLLDLTNIEDKFIQLLMQSDGATGGSTMTSLKTILDYTFLRTQKDLIKKLYMTISELIVNTTTSDVTTTNNINRYRRIVHILNKETNWPEHYINWIIPSKEHESSCIRLLELLHKSETSTVLIQLLFNDYIDPSTGNKKSDYEYNKQFVKHKCEEYYPELMKKLEFLHTISESSYLTIYKAQELKNLDTVSLPEFTYE